MSDPRTCGECRYFTAPTERTREGGTFTCAAFEIMRTATQPACMRHKTTAQVDKQGRLL